MSSQNKRVRRNERESEGYQFLDCMKLLYCEAIRLEFFRLADALEGAFENSSSALKEEGLLIQDNHQAIVEFNFIKGFRKLDKKQQLLLVESIQSAESRKVKN